MVKENLLGNWRSELLSQRRGNFRFAIIGKNGAAYRTRTCDPRITNAMLYQLS